MSQITIFPIVEFCDACGLECYCGHDERALRRIIAGTWEYGPMTPEQRQWCIEEADSAGEGSWKVEDLIPLSDVELARAVLDAWWDYVRSNCLP